MPLASESPDSCGCFVLFFFLFFFVMRVLDFSLTAQASTSKRHPLEKGYLE